MRSAHHVILAVGVLVTGWLVGSAVGVGIGLLLDGLTGAWVSWTLGTVPLGGLAGIIVGAWWGVRLAFDRT